MALEPLRAAATRLVAAALAVAALASPAHALRVTTWNLLDYPANNFAGRQPQFLTVMSSLNTDVMIVQELKSAAGADSFLNVLKAGAPSRVWKGGASTFLSACESALYYDSLLVTNTTLVALATAGPRDVLIGVIKPNGYKSTQAQFRVYSVHLKAGLTAGPPPDSSVRRLECGDIRNHMNSAAAGTNLLFGGDTNFYGDWEGGYQRLVESQLDNDGRMKDLLSMPGTWNSSGYALYESQCPCASGCGAFFSGGGLDDRFDLWLGSYSLNDGLGLDVVPGNLPGGYGAYGNDGNHFNTDVNGSGFNTQVPIAVANALHDASDHLPVIITLQLPAKLGTSNALAFGDAILGGAPALDLTVDNVPAAPAATLGYSFTAPAGFTAPGGSFSNLATSPAATHAIGMLTASTGVKSGTLLVNSNDLDTTAKPVLLTGRVLAHAVPSLDSSAVVETALLDFGTHLEGEFTDADVRVHNHGWNTLQSRLNVDAAVITGGNGHFALVPAFGPALLSGVGHTWTVRFLAGATTADSTYEATLTISSDDDNLPGALPRNDLVLTLRGRRASGTDAVGDLPTALRFLPPSPNPAHRGSLLAFDLPQRAHVQLAVFDAHGRRVALLADGERDAGHHALRWSAEDESGRPLAAGLYFVRFTAPGLVRVARLAILP